jgi:hypothetical protein
MEHVNMERLDNAVQILLSYKLTSKSRVQDAHCSRQANRHVLRSFVSVFIRPPSFSFR